MGIHCPNPSRWQGWLCVLIGLVALLDGRPGWAQPQARLIRLESDRRLSVAEVPLDAATKPQPGLLIWSGDGERERWQWFDQQSAWPPSGDAAETTLALSAASRGGSQVSGGGEQALLTSTIQLAQLQTGVALRGGLPLTPVSGGFVLNPRPTFRRLPAKNDKVPYPAETASLEKLRGGTKLQLHFAPGHAAVAWDDLTDVPKEWAAGLPPDQYLVRLEAGAAQFTVLDEQERNARLRPVQELQTLVGEVRSPLVLQFHVERLLDERDGNGPPRFLADALDVLESVPDTTLTPYLREQRAQVQRWLENLAQDPGYRNAWLAGVALDDPTGLPEIDGARELIAAGQWSEALRKLTGLKAPQDGPATRRVAGLKALYTAVIGAEAGLGRQDETEAAFATALEQLRDGAPTDLLRAHVNSGNYLLRQAQDRLHNHAFQMAAGVRLPFLSTLQLWNSAREHYEAAQQIVAQQPGADDAALHVNLARLYALLADLIETLDAPVQGQRRFAPGLPAARAQACQHAAAAGRSARHDVLRGTAAEIQAHLAFRQDERPAARQHAQTAVAAYLNAGYSAGLESTHRLLGLLSAQTDQPQEAIRHLKISQLLAEALRDRFPSDQVGLSRAGFFARRSYVYERLVELLLATGQPAEALRYAELAKARSAQDLLTTGGLRDAAEPAEGQRDLAGLLAAWPRGVAALEYFLGDQHAWLFTVDPAGKVTAVTLRGRDGRPLTSRELVRRVRVFLSRTENQAARMAQGLLSGRGFDTSWQDDLHQFYDELLPADVRGALSSAQQVVVVPHHILHYFPFAALVTKRDSAPRKKTETISPRFLVDAPYHLIYAPSLTVWDLLRQQPPPKLNRAQAVGIVEVPGAPPLPGVGKDLENFQAVFGKAVQKILQGPEARRDQALKILGEFGVLLLATHGFNEADHPLDSYLLFLPPKGAETTDPFQAGRLTAREIFETRVRASMVVMSACFSGLGDRSPLPGDDLFGLQRAFLQAGARTVVSGLWDVYDGTAPDLIQSYFRHVAHGQPASQALAEAQREFLNRLRATGKPDVYEHPYFWAVYTVAGDDRTRVEP